MQWVSDCLSALDAAFAEPAAPSVDLEDSLVEELDEVAWTQSHYLVFVAPYRDLGKETPVGLPDGVFDGGLLCLDREHGRVWKLLELRSSGLELGPRELVDQVEEYARVLPSPEEIFDFLLVNGQGLATHLDSDFSHQQLFLAPYDAILYQELLQPTA